MAYQPLFSVISRTLVGGGVLPLCRGAVSVFYSPSWLGKWGLRDRQFRHWLVQFFYLIQFLEEWGFCWRGFISWRDFLSYSLVFGRDIGSLLSSNTKTFFIKDSYENEHFRLANKPQIILYSYYFLTGQPIKCADLRPWEEFLFHLSNFDCSSNQTTI